MKKGLIITFVVIAVLTNLPPFIWIIISYERDINYYSYSSSDNPELAFEENGKDPTVFRYSTVITDSLHRVRYPDFDTLLYRNFKINPFFFWHWAEYFYDARYKLPYISKEQVAKNYLIKINNRLNLDIVDSLQGYPCVQEMILKLAHINSIADEILKKIAGSRVWLVAKFSVADLPTNVDFECNSIGSFEDIKSEIKISKLLLTESSKEYIAITFLNSIIQAYIQANSLEHKKHPEFLEKIFPIFFSANLPDEKQVEIAKLYTTEMKGLIKRINPNLSATYAEALAWGGLQGTTVWRTKSDTNYIKEVYTKARKPTSLNKVNYNFKSCN